MNRRTLLALTLLVVVIIGGMGGLATASRHVHLCHTNNADWCRGPDGTSAEHWRHHEDGHKHRLFFG